MTDFILTSAAAERDTTLDAAPRIAVLPSGPSDNVEVSVAYSSTATTGGSRHHGVVARHADADNYLRLSHQQTTSVEDVWVEKVIGGVPTVIATLGGPMAPNTTYRLRLSVYQTGFGVATWMSLGGAVLGEVAFSDDDLAAGGTLESGGVGIIDRNGSAVASTRSYTGFSASALPPEPVVMNPGRSLEFRHDGVLRENAAGGLWGEPWYRGDRVLIPQAGYMNRDTRIAVKVRRDDVDATANTETGASTIVQVNYTPRFRMPARTA